MRKLKEIVVSDDKQASCASFAASLGPRMPPNILPMNLIAAPATADARCFKFQNDCTESSSTGTSRSYIVNTHRQKVGDIYDPGHGRRLQIRNDHRQIIGYIEHDGTVTNTHRQRVREIDLD